MHEQTDKHLVIDQIRNTKHVNDMDAHERADLEKKLARMPITALDRTLAEFTSRP